MTRRTIYTTIVFLSIIIGMILVAQLEGEEQPTVEPNELMQDSVSIGYYETEQIEIYKP